MKNLILRSNGFSTAEVLVALGLLGIMSTVMAETVTQYGKGLVSIGDKSNVITLGDDINDVLLRIRRNPTLCSTSLSFKGKINSKESVEMAIALAADQIIEKGTRTTEGVEVLSLSFSQAELIKQNSTEKIFSAPIALAVKHREGHHQVRPRRLSNLTIKTSLDGTFQSCDVGGDELRQYCESLGGVFSESESPPCRFPPVADGMCPPDEFVVGIAGGKIVCSEQDDEETFILGGASCGPAFCAAVDTRSYADFRYGTPNGHTPSVVLAEDYCKSRGYSNTKTFSVVPGYRGQPQAGVGGANLYTNAYGGNLTFSSITCTKNTNTIPQCPSGYRYNPSSVLWTLSGYYTGPGCDR